MSEHNLGSKIAELRKQNHLTQLELARQLGVTDKAVSKWERNLSCPDVHTLPKLAAILNVTVDQLMQGTDTAPSKAAASHDFKQLVFRSVALAMGVALVVLSALKQLDLQTGFGLAGVGLSSLSLHAFFGAKE